MNATRSKGPGDYWLFVPVRTKAHRRRKRRCTVASRPTTVTVSDLTELPVEARADWRVRPPQGGEGTLTGVPSEPHRRREAAKREAVAVRGRSL